uniref:Uncharacterized protein n=1 Tax=Cucumis melo TaxID=3656 RepID=A0A9I9E6J0_CUCME
MNRSKSLWINQYKTPKSGKFKIFAQAEAGHRTHLWSECSIFWHSPVRRVLRRIELYMLLNERSMLEALHHTHKCQ